MPIWNCPRRFSANPIRKRSCGTRCSPWPPRSAASTSVRSAARSGASCTGLAKPEPLVRLPFDPPLQPMLSSAAEGLPGGEGWLFEPKWDGFRTLVFRDGDEVYLQSRDRRPLARYFPELLAPIRESLPARSVLDGEIVIVGPAGLDFSALLLRIHPAASRIKLLASQTPASFVAFDLLALGGEDLREAPQAERRARLEAALGRVNPPLYLTPAT